MVSWLPDRALTRDQTVTAVLLAQTTSLAAQQETPEFLAARWPHIGSWAGEPGLSGPDVISRLACEEESGTTAGGAAQWAVPRQP